MVTGEGSVQGAVEEKDTAVRWGTVAEVGRRGDLEECRTDPKRIVRGVESRERGPETDAAGEAAGAPQERHCRETTLRFLLILEVTGDKP